MLAIYILLSAALVVAQFVVPRRYAFLPLLIAVCTFQNMQVVNLGVKFTPCKLVIMAGLLRAFSQGMFRWSSRQPLDVLAVLWAGWLILSSFAHHPKDHNPLTIRLSGIYDFLGGYLYARCYLRNMDDYLRFIKCLAIVLLPLAFFVVIERVKGTNYIGMIAGGMEEPEIRNGRVRAAGAFGHSILLGTFCATSAILLIPLWRLNRRWAIAGTAACVITAYCSASSTPIMTLMSGLFGVALWRFRTSVGKIRALIIALFVTLHLMMQAPVWYLMARIDLAGGSTGWHRAELITAAIKHFGDWWFTGTDYTRNWISYGVPWSEYHIDITNQYISMGVIGGLPLMLLYIGMFWKSFQQLGRGMRPLRQTKSPYEFVLWCVGSSLLAHCFTFLSIAYFDQSSVFVSIVIGAIPGMCAVAYAKKKVAAQVDAAPLMTNQQAPNAPPI